MTRVAQGEGEHQVNNRKRIRFMSLAVVAASALMAAGTASAAPVSSTADAPVTAAAMYETGPETTVIHKTPSSSAPTNGSLGPRTTIEISCQTEGSSVSGPYGTSTIWDKIGYQKYIPDSYVNTGSDGYVTKRC